MKTFKLALNFLVCWIYRPFIFNSYLLYISWWTIEILWNWEYLGFSQLILGYKQTFTVKTLRYWKPTFASSEFQFRITSVTSQMFFWPVFFASTCELSNFPGGLIFMIFTASPSAHKIIKEGNITTLRLSEKVLFNNHVVSY